MPSEVLKFFDRSKRVCSFKIRHYRAVKKNTIECVSKSESQVLHPLNCFSGAYNAKNPETQGKKSETVLPVKYIVKLGAGEAGGRRGTNTCPC